MPSLKAYTPYETLAFCQSVAHHGSDAAAFDDIAAALNTNQLIRETQTYDEARFTANALRDLYQELLSEEKTVASPTVNGDNGSNAVNPRKRKLSPSPAVSHPDAFPEQQLVQSLLDKLYLRFREQTIREIRQEEEAYNALQVEIAELERPSPAEHGQPVDAESVKIRVQSPVDLGKPDQVQPHESDSQTNTGATPGQTTVVADSNGPAPHGSRTTISTPLKSSASPPLATSGGAHHPVAASRSPSSPSPSAAAATTLLPAPPATDGTQPRSSQPSPAQAHPPHHSPGPFQQNLSVPSPQRPGYGPINPQHFQPGPQGQPVSVMGPGPGMPHMPPPSEYPPHKRGGSSGQGRGSPIPMVPQQQYPGYPGYHQPPWPHHPPPQHPYPQPYPNAPYYVPSPAGRPAMGYQTPHPPAYHPYPQSAPMHYPGQPPPHGWYPQPGQPYYHYPGSPNVTPVPRSESKPPLSGGRSSTPWKRRSQSASAQRQPSPVRPERDVSPLTDSESPSRPSKATKSPGKREVRADEGNLTAHEAATSRGRQAASTTPSAFAGSRSQSITSFTSDTPITSRKKGRPSQAIKAEPHGTPTPVLSDTEPHQRPAARRGRPRNGTVVAKSDSNQPTTAVKRKRSPDRDSPSPSLPSSRAHLARQPSHDSSLVSVSKNFNRTAQLLLNEIVSHKLAGIFAKPLSERDAPGYKDLVLRPQDLKSIKAAISKGGKAALAAIDALEEGPGDGESTGVGGADTPNHQTSGASSGAGERSLGNGVYLVKMSEDLVPPRGIVNSTQLEMELVRMFANAVMFNPLASTERGFGRSLRLRRRGGDVHPSKSNGEDPDADGVSSEGSEAGTGPDEGGIISDTREMFEDVLQMVGKWREVELERLGGTTNGEDHAGGGAAGTKAVQTPAPAQGSASVSVNLSANASARHSSVDDDDGAASASARTPGPASSTGTARKRRRIAEN